MQDATDRSLMQELSKLAGQEHGLCVEYRSETFRVDPTGIQQMSLRANNLAASCAMDVTQIHTNLQNAARTDICKSVG